MVSRSSSDPVTFGEMEGRFAEVVGVMNERTGQLQTRFQDMDVTHARHEQMIMVMEATVSARIQSIEEHLKAQMEKDEKNEQKLGWLNNKVIAMDAGLEDVTQQVSQDMVNAIGNISGD